MAYKGFPEILVSAYLPKSSGHTERLLINKDTGALVIPPEVGKITGFFLKVRVPGHGLDVVIVRKDVGTNGGGYHMEQIAEVEPGHVWRTTSPIEVVVDQNTGLRYTPWHKKFSNRVDIFIVRPGEEIFLWQAGVVVRGNPGQETYHLIDEELWRGYVVLNQATGLWTGVPADPSYGSFESRRPIFSYEPFRRALLRSSGGLAPRVLAEEEINPPLGLPPEGCYRSNWWILFMGQRGQGMGVDWQGNPVQLAGNEILDLDDLKDPKLRHAPIPANKVIMPDADGVIRLPRGKDVRSLGIRAGYNPKRKDGPKYPQGIYWA
jgi:hypothetical protein